MTRRAVTRLLGVVVLVLSGCRPAAIVVAPVGLLRSEPVATGRSHTSAEQFGSLFCAVLNHLPDASQWGYCARYFQPAATPVALAPSIPTNYRVVVVPGIFGQCVESIARPFEDAVSHLRSTHGLDVEYIPVSAVGGVPYNARAINSYLDRQFGGSDQRPYIAVGYSKGASDILEAIHESPSTANRVAGIVTIAGSVLGSRLTDSAPRSLLDFLQAQRLGTCDIGDGKGLDDLHRSERVRGMEAYLSGKPVPAFSIAAVSTFATTSRVLQDGWRQLSVHSLEQDSQMLHEDAVIPGGAYLGAALGDHWAVALPFETARTSDPHVKDVITNLIDQNHYPRTALLEAALRFAMGAIGVPPRP